MQPGAPNSAVKDARAPSALARCGAALTGLALVAGCYLLARSPVLSLNDARELSADFSFERTVLPSGQSAAPMKGRTDPFVRDVHPVLKRTEGWVSSLGAAVTLADLDGDGLPNDVIWVDPRTDLVSMACCPGTPQRYSPVCLEAPPIPAHPDRVVAPMGSAAADFDEDGVTDVLVYYWGRPPVLFIGGKSNAPGAAPSYRAQDVGDPGQYWYSNAISVIDLDGDGHLDVIIGNFYPDGSHILEPSSTAPAVNAGLGRAKNGGGHHVFRTSVSRQPKGGNAVAFQEVPDAFPPNVKGAWTLAQGSGDLDGDLLPELYLAHDFGPDTLLHNRSKPGEFRFVEMKGERGFLTPRSCAVGGDSCKGMGCDFADVDQDGVLDIYVSNISAPWALMEGHFLWASDLRHRPGMTVESLKTQMRAEAHPIAPYVNVADRVGLSVSGWGWNSNLADFNNDGRLEAIQAVGFMAALPTAKPGVHAEDGHSPDMPRDAWVGLQALGTSNAGIIQRASLWPSFRKGVRLSGEDCDPFFVWDARRARYFDVCAYKEVREKLALTEPMSSRGIALADVDHDGRLDYALGNQFRDSYFYHNTGVQRSYLGLTIVLPIEGGQGDGFQVLPAGTKPPPASPAIGASVSVRDDTRDYPLVAQVDCSNGHSGHRSPEIHFGLGQRAGNAPVEVTIEWRDRTGKTHKAQQPIQPGWHTVVLGQPQ